MSESPATGKGRPTPKRKDAQRRHGGPIAPPPTTRKEAAKRVRAQGKQRRQDLKSGRATDSSRMMARDQGPVRRLVRDLVDSRRHVGVLLLPATVLPVVVPLVTENEPVLAFATSLWLAAVLAAVFDMFLTGAIVSRRVKADFPSETRTRGHVFYAVVRTAQFRRFRLPPPLVGPGDPV